MSKMNPILLDEYFKAFNRPIEGIQNDGTERTQLRRPIPSITTMDQHINPLPQIISNFQRPI